MDLARFLRHVFASRWLTRRRFSDAVDAAIESAIESAEKRTGGEIRFVIETALHPAAAWRGQSPRDRALDVFGQFRVWDTDERNGVLIYVLVADRDVEIVADRGAAAAVSPAGWEEVARRMEAEFRAGRFGDGAVAGVAGVGSLLEKHFPARPVNRDELPNQPTLL
ncbi:MAG TPA: TPM domain-containing protein [Steroidobacteraceae bacterium]|nr:TPM domain-containing protein [Steroidobacteraceae bacterium]